MIRNLLCLLACLLVGYEADALDFELGTGTTYAQTSNGMWYQEGFPYTLNKRSGVWVLSASSPINEHLRWRVSYADLGQYAADADATPVDDNYSSVTRSCIGPCVAISRFVGLGSMRDVSAVLEVHTTGTGWTYGASAGVTMFQAKWREVVTNWKQQPQDAGQTIEWHSGRQWRPGAIFGVSATRGPLSWRLDWHDNRCFHDVCGMLASDVFALTLNYRF